MFLASAWFVLTGALGHAAEPTASELLHRYDEIMSPQRFEMEVSMSATRENGSVRSYDLRVLRGPQDALRVWFTGPASVKGQEMLRSGDNLWVYLPNLKRGTRLSNRDSFQGGDFNNADVLRVGYSDDYTPTLGQSEIPDTFLLQLKAKNPNTAYDTIKLWMRRSDSMPIQGQFFGTGGQMLRSATFSDFKRFGSGYQRPTRIAMRNELVKTRSSEMVLHSLQLNVDAPAQRFVLSDLGR